MLFKKMLCQGILAIVFLVLVVVAGIYCVPRKTLLLQSLDLKC